VPLSGAHAGTALPVAQSDGRGILQATDGSVLIVGGSGPADWAVRRLSVNGQDALTDAVVQPINYPLSNAGLSISQGMVQHAEAGPALGAAPPVYWLYSHAIDPGTLGTGSVQLPLDAGTLSEPLPCAPGGACIRIADATLQGAPYLGAGPDVYLQTLDGSFPFSEPVASLPSADASIIDASPGYVLVDGTHPSRQYIVSAVVPFGKVTATPVTGAALWFDTLWSADGRGRLQATNLVTKARSRPVRTGSRCTATAVQATQRWLYWSCGSAGPAGVYDLSRHRDVTVPGGPVLLGDGYLVAQAGSDLVMYDVHADRLARSVTLATDVAKVAGSDGRNVTFAVDKYSGDIAYVTPSDDVVLVNSGVPTTPPAILAVPGHPVATAFGPRGGWSADLRLTRPVTRWTLVIRRAGSSKIVYRQPGGPGRMDVTVGWNGYLSGHHRARAGAYVWSLVVVSAGGTGRYAIRGGMLTLR
jgi:hypothetical protein